MAKENAVFLFKPENIEGADVQNAHVFDGYYDADSEAWKFYSGPSRCGKVFRKDRKGSALRETDEKKFCHELIEGHDKIFNVCGMCMASFFADGE